MVRLTSVLESHSGLGMRQIKGEYLHEYCVCLHNTVFSRPLTVVASSVSSEVWHLETAGYHLSVSYSHGRLEIFCQSVCPYIL